MTGFPNPGNTQAAKMLIVFPYGLWHSQSSALPLQAHGLKRGSKENTAPRARGGELQGASGNPACFLLEMGRSFPLHVVHSTFRLYLL